MDFLRGRAPSPPRPLLFSSTHLPADSPLRRPACVREFDAETAAKTGTSATAHIAEVAYVPGDADGALVHEILWDHFGFIPHESDPGLDWEAHKLRVSPLPAACSSLPASGIPSSSWNTRVRTADAGDVLLLSKGPSLPGRPISLLHAFRPSLRD
ncbi:hypothetical protein L226DRAFT_532353 [Lentinus tigrinus ALCF2SS1-7]|uniref:uncharacterized protein n=1 Tax=Lentinus tigrinus ALCF2SS1-7 TaxID=1328758 RepID=UPI00116609F2|nr:hypothetical protein L226DRAFT_532353 [Lentinus tigrinus ALCF2SS1-7]